MDKKTIVGKTAKGLREASGKTSLLTRDTRKLLKEIDGKASFGDLLRKLDDWSETELEEALNLMLQEDFVRELILDEPARAPSPPPPRSPAPREPEPEGEELDFMSLAAAADRDAEERAKREAGERAKQLAAQLDRQKAEAQAKQQAAELARREAEEKAKAEAAERARHEAAEKAKREAEERAKAEAAARARHEAAEKAKAEAAEAAKREAEEKAKAEAAERARHEAAEKAKREAEEKAKAEAAEKARREAEERARHAVAEKAKREAEEKTKREAEERARREAEEKAKAEAAERARHEAAEKAKREAEERAQAEAAEKAKREAEEKARREAEERTQREAEEKAQAEAAEKAKREAEERAKREAEEKARREAEERARREAVEREEREAGERARREAEARAEREAEERAERAAEELARQHAEEDARHAAEERSRREVAEADVAAAAVLEVAPPRRSAKWGLIATLAVVGLLIVGLGAIHVISFDSRIAQLEKAATAQLQQPVKIRSIHMSLLPQPHWRLEGLAIGAEGEIRVPRAKMVASLGSLFGDAKVFESVYLDSPVLNEEGLRWVMFGQAAGGDLNFGRVSATNAKLESKNFAVPAFNASVVMGEDGNWRTMSAESADGKFGVDAQSAADGVQISLKAASLAGIVASASAVEDITATAIASRGGLNVGEFKGRVSGGSISGTARMKWAAGSILEGTLAAAHIDTAQMFQGLMESGRLDGKASFSLPVQEGGKAASPRLEGDFVVDKGAVAGVDLGRMLQGGADGGQTQFSKLSGSVSHQGGRTQLRALRLDAGKLSASGSADVDESQNIRGQFVVELSLGAERRRAGVAMSGPFKAPFKNIEWSRR